MEQTEKLTTRDGQVTVTIIDESQLSADRVVAYLIKNSFSAEYARVTDKTSLVPKQIKDILIKDVEKR